MIDMHDVVTIGSITRDAFFSADFETIPWPKTPSRSAYVLPRGEKMEVKNVYFTMGGNAANAAVTFARQGFKTAAVGKTGKDVSGEEIRRKLRGEGVETRYMAETAAVPTAYSVLLLENGERTILGYHGASDTFALRDVKLPALKAKWWYVSLAGESDNMFLPLVHFAKKNKIAVAFNPSGHQIKHKRGEILRALKDISFLAVNDEEASLLTGIPWRREHELFKKLDALLSPGILAVTTGATGVTVSDGKCIYKAGTFKEKKLVDRTGAGDAFGSGFVAGLMRRGVNLPNIHRASPEDVSYAIRLATANATSKVEEVGATEGLLTKREFENPRWKNLKINIKKS
ncbi:MAG TPA: carbohydrate kinase family protein [Candidatus Paceibacterota bacterium]|nr:carbohydrate kinase family protein [Candidatus Paceibacterota bacterium]